MKYSNDEGAGESQSPLVVRLDGDFQQKVLDKLGRLEAKVDMLSLIHI